MGEGESTSRSPDVLRGFLYQFVLVFFFFLLLPICLFLTIVLFIYLFDFFPREKDTFS